MASRPSPCLRWRSFQQFDQPIDHLRLDFRFIPLHIDDDLISEGFGDLRDAIGAALMAGRGHDGVGIKRAQSFDYSLIVGRHNHARNPPALKCLIDHMLHQRFSGR